MAAKKEAISKLKDQGPCWKDYEPIGMKKGRGGKMVPNCVPKRKKKEGEDK